MSYMKRNKKREQTLESAQYGLEIIFGLLLNDTVQLEWLEHHYNHSNRKSNVTGILEKDGSLKWDTFFVSPYERFLHT